MDVLGLKTEHVKSEKLRVEAVPTALRSSHVICSQSDGSLCSRSIVWNRGPIPRASVACPKFT